MPKSNKMIKEEEGPLLGKKKEDIKREKWIESIEEVIPVRLKGGEGEGIVV